MEQGESSLTIFTRAAVMLAEADTIQKAKELKDLALTAADWAKRKDMGEEAIQHCRAYALRAKDRMGQLLAETERAKGVRTVGGGTGAGGDVALPPAQPPTLAALGITKRESSEAQKLAALPEPVKEAVFAGTKTETQARREAARTTITENPPLPSGKYRVFYADPPWCYSDKCAAGSVQSGGAEVHYPSMTIAELCAMPIRDLAEPDAVLFLWVTSPMLADCWPVIHAWGFSYKASFVWDKVKHNMGHYNSVRHELLLVCTRGSCLPDSSQLTDSVQSIERTAHSVKPSEFRSIIESMYATGARLELFARTQAPGWVAYGNQLPA